MKKLLFPVLVIFTIQLGVAQQYTIKGTITGLEEGMILALGNMDKNNELARVTPGKDGAFEFTGKVDEICRAIIRVKEADSNYVISYISFYLENESYELKSSLEELQYATFLGTSEHNNIANILADLLKENRKKISAIDEFRRNLPKKEVPRTFERDGEVIETTMSILDSTKIDFEALKKLDLEHSELVQELLKTERHFVDKYTNSYPALVILNGYAARNKRAFDEEERRKKLQSEGRVRPQNILQTTPSISDEELADYYEEFSKKLKRTTVGKAYYTNLYERLGIKEGDKYYEFDGCITLDEKPFKVSDVDNEYILLAFTSVGCSGCQKFNKAMIPEYHKIKDKIEIVAYYTTVNIEHVRTHTEEKQIKWHVVSDYKGNNSPVKNRYQVHAIPQFFLLDKDRNVIKYQGGFSEEFVDYLVDLGSD